MEYNSLSSFQMENGLHQKAVSRFIKMMENNIDEMHILFLSKQLHLMFNIIKTYWDKVDFEIWLKFNDLLNSMEKQFHEIISKDDKPKRKKKVENVFKKIIEILKLKIEVQNNVA